MLALEPNYIGLNVLGKFGVILKCQLPIPNAAVVSPFFRLRETPKPQVQLRKTQRSKARKKTAAKTRLALQGVSQKDQRTTAR